MSYNNESFLRFLDALDNYLYSEGWYVQGQRIKARGLSTYEEVEQYLFEHCYDKAESKKIVEKIRLETL